MGLAAGLSAGGGGDPALSCLWSSATALHSVRCWACREGARLWLLSTTDVYLLINTHDLKNYEINLKGTQNVPVGFKVCVMHSDIRPVQCLDWWGLKCGYIQR